MYHVSIFPDFRAPLLVPLVPVAIFSKKVHSRGYMAEWLLLLFLEPVKMFVY